MDFNFKYYTKAYAKEQIIKVTKYKSLLWMQNNKIFEPSINQTYQNRKISNNKYN